MLPIRGTALFFFAGLCSAAYAESVTHIADGQIFEFDVDAERVAIHCLERRSGILLKRPLDPVQGGPFVGWSIVRRAAGDRTSIREIVASLAREPGVFASPRLIDSQGDEVLVTPDLFVGFAADVSHDQAAEILAATGEGEVTAFDYSRMPGIHRFRCATGDGFEVLARIEALRSHPSVRFAECDFVMRGRYLAATTDPFYLNNWGLENTGTGIGIGSTTFDIDVDAPEAWDWTLGAGVTVVVFDGGVQSTHPDLNMAPGKDFTPDAGNGDPFNSCDVHGTTVAGCISGLRNNGLGSVGVAPEAKVASARIASSAVPCNGTFASQASIVISGLDWAQSIGARVTNFSLTFNVSSSALTSKFQSTKDAGLVHFVAAGNAGTALVQYPATLTSVNTISGIDFNGARAFFTGGCVEWAASSSFGPTIDFAMPAEDIPTTDLVGAAGYTNSDYACIDGTSYSSAFAAGVAALVLSVAPTLASTEVEQILRDTAFDLGPIGPDQEMGFGIPKAFAALVAALERIRRDIVLAGPASVFTSWSAGQAAPSPREWTLTYTGNTATPTHWSAVVEGGSFVTVTPSSGTLDATTSSIPVSVLLDPVGLPPGLHQAKIRFTHDGDPNEAHEIPITLSIDRTAFVLGDSLDGSIDGSLGVLDADSACFRGTAGQKLSLWLAPAAGNQKLRVTVRGPSGSVAKSFKAKAKLGKPSKKSITLKESGLHTLEVSYVSGAAAPYRIVTSNKKLPLEVLTKQSTKIALADGSPLEFDFSAAADAILDLRIESSTPLALLQIALRSPSGAMVSPMGAPSYPFALEYGDTPLGEPGVWKIVVKGAQPGTTMYSRTQTPVPMNVPSIVTID